MDALTQIIARIEQENAAACDQIVLDAKQQADTIVAQAAKQADALTDQRILEGKKRAAAWLAKSTSAAEQTLKRKLLGARVWIIDGVLQKALAALAALPTEAYFDTLCELVTRFAEPGEAVLRLCDRDFARMPESFPKTVNDALAGRCHVRVEGGAENISGGFLLCYAETVINAGWEALLEDVRDEVKDDLNRMLFD